jgi:hypothetical protein
MTEPKTHVIDNNNNNPTYDKIGFIYDYDKHEPYLSYFDDAGVEVYLQVESGYADMEELIEIVLERYKHHKSVIGFGVDVEWYESRDPDDMNGEAHFDPVSDSSAEAWEKKVKSYNSNYRLFLKHWDTDMMPDNYRGDIVFIDDSQMFMEYHGCQNEDECVDAMVRKFSDGWAQHFYPNPVQFQVGYDRDKKWWDLIDDPNPIQKIGKAISDPITQRGQECGIIWVDFTFYDVVGTYPVNGGIDNNIDYAGFRSSKYGLDPFPTPEEWTEGIKEIVSHFQDNATPCAIWIIGTMGKNGYCNLEFPKPLR